MECLGTLNRARFMDLLDEMAFILKIDLNLIQFLRNKANNLV